MAEQQRVQPISDAGRNNCRSPGEVVVAIHYDDVLAAVSTVGADVTSDCERFLTEMVKNYTGDKSNIAQYIRENVFAWFKVVDAYPEWIQNADWQFHQGRPMVFVGQLPIPKSSELFHDDAIVFVCLSDVGTMKTVIQVA